MTPEITVKLVADATPPKVKRTLPGAGTLLSSLQTITAFFSEPINPLTLNGLSWQIRSAGTDNKLGTADDGVLPNGVFSYRDDLNAAVMTFANSPPAGIYQVSIGAPLADPAGNVVTAPFTSLFYVSGGIDSDGDGVPDIAEIALGLDPKRPSSFNDGVLDGDRDSDGDGLPNKWEILFGYDPSNPDTDGNGIPDGQEDPDNDRLTNLQELALHTNPRNADTDGDGWSDEAEVTGQGNPLDPNVGPRLFVSAAPPLNALVTGPGELQATLIGTVVAEPATTVLVSGLGELTKITLGMVVAQPPLSMLTTGLVPFDAVIFGTFLAQPPLSVLVSGLGQMDSVTPGTMLALPPLNIRINPQ